jgi:conserved domain protein
MEKEKVLEIEFLKVWDNKWAWKITKNNLDFKNTGVEIISNDIKINCANKESLYLFDNWLVEWELLDDFNLINSTQKTEIEEFVKYINSTYGIPYRWRARPHEKFFCIYANGEISTTQDDYGSYKESFYELGNYFKTKEEAQKVIDSKEWQEFWEKVRAGEIGGEND